MKTGDRVVCVRTMVSRSGNRSVIKGTVYTIYDIFICSCGNVHYDVGHANDTGRGNCTNCPNRAPDNHVWCDYRLFAPIEYNSAHNELIENIVEERIDIKEPVHEESKRAI